MYTLITKTTSYLHSDEGKLISDYLENLKQKKKRKISHHILGLIRPKARFPHDRNSTRELAILHDIFQ